MSTLNFGLTVTVRSFWVNTVVLLSHFNHDRIHGVTLGKAGDYVSVA